MSAHTWWLFVTVAFLVSATPGPNMLLIMSTSARSGFRAAVASMAGCLSAMLSMMTLSAAGLGALLQAFPSVFDALRWIGAAYLLYLGIRTWRSPVGANAARGTASVDGAQGEGRAQAPQAALRAQASMEPFRRGLLVAFSNPKAILFAAAFLPQFIRPELPKLPQFAILLLTFLVVEIGWYLIYAASGQRLANYLRRTVVMKAFNRVTGGVFVGFAAIMAAVRS
jgi:threonine/homoserine/homoserine lactone efflux protein